MENHGNVTFLGWNGGDITVANEDAAAVDLFEARKHTQGGGFTAAGRADKNKEFAVANLQIYFIHRGLVIAGVDACDIVKSHCCHSV